MADAYTDHYLDAYGAPEPPDVPDGYSSRIPWRGGFLIPDGGTFGGT